MLQLLVAVSSCTCVQQFTDELPEAAPRTLTSGKAGGSGGVGGGVRSGNSSYTCGWTAVHSPNKFEQEEGNGETEADNNAKCQQPILISDL